MKPPSPAATALAPPDLLAATLARGGADAHGPLAALARHADALGGRAHDYARALPRALGGLAPEHQRAVAALWTQLDAPGAGLPLPAWRAVVTDAAARVAWWRAELLADPSALDGCPDSRELRHAVASLPTADLAAPLPLADALLRRPEAHCHERALALLDACLTDSTAPIDAVFDRLCALAERAATPLRAAALGRLSAPWASHRPRPALVAAGLRADETRRAALQCAASWRLEGPLRGALALAPPADAAFALVALADVVTPPSLGPVIAEAARRGAWLAPQLLRFLATLHQRGVFAQEEALDDVLAVLRGAPEADADAWATVLYTLREALLARATEASPDDRAGVGVASVVMALARVAPAAFGDRAVAWVESLVERAADDDAAAALLPLLARAARPSSEAAVLRWLPALGAEALPAVVACGGETSVAALARALAVDGGAPAPWAEAAVEPAAEALYRLVAHDPAARDAVLRRVELRRLATVRGWFARAPSPLLLATLAPETERLLALPRLVVHAGGGLGELGAIEALLATHVHEVTASHLVGKRPEQETVVAPEAVAALADMTRRLRAAGYVRPAPLARDPSDDALAAELLLTLLARAEADPVRATLLRSLGSLRSPRVAPALVRWIHDRDVAVRVAATRALAAAGGGAVALHFARALASPHAEVARAALDALRALGTRAAARAVTALLEHPTMNLKKAAAAALGALGDRASVAPLLGWLGRHDNPGLRASLLASLDALLGPAANAALLGALDAAVTPRERGLLVAALDGRLSLRAARAHRAAPWFDDLAAALRDGAVALADAPAAALLDAPAGAAAPPPEGPLDRWVSAGVPVDEALTFALAWRAHELPSARALPVARRDAAAFLRRLEGADAAARDPVVSLLAAAFAGVSDPDLLRPLRPAVDLLVAVPPGAARSPHRALLRAVVPLLDDAARWRVAERWRALPPEPDADAADTLDLLRACGRAVTRVDLDALLAQVGRVASPPDVAAAVVARALRVALPPPPAALAARVAEALHTDDGARSLAPAEDEAPLAFIAAVARALPWLDAPRRALALDAVTALWPLDVADWRGAPPPAAHRPPAAPPKQAAPDAPARYPDAVRAMRDGARPVTALPWVLPLWLDAATGGPAWLAALARDLDDAAARDDRAALATVHQRLHRLAAAIAPGEARVRVWRSLVGALVPLWVAAPPSLRGVVHDTIRRCPTPMLGALLAPSVAAGQWGLLALVSTVAADAPLAALLPAARAGGYQGALPAVVDGALRWNGALREPTTVPMSATPRDPRAVLDALADCDAELVRRALKALAREGAEALRPYLDRALDDPRPRVRDLAARLVRAQGTRAEHLALARERLHDRRVTVRVSAMRSLSHARDAAALPALVAALLAPENAVRHAARAALRLYGEEGLRCLDDAARRERPDRARRLAAEREALVTH